MSETGDGLIAYRLRHPGKGGTTHRVMTPLEFLARLAVLIPPSRHPLLRYYGVFAPNSSLRKLCVPESPPKREQATCAHNTKHQTLGPGEAAKAAPETAPPVAAPRWIDWVTLLKRTFDFDVSACPCGGRLRPVEVVAEKPRVVELLTELGLPTSAPLIARARPPDWE